MTDSSQFPFLSSGGEMAALIASHDWSTTPLGPIEGWPQHRKFAVAFILRSPVPMATLWGEAGVMIYNEGYAAIAGGRHPALLGANVREAWPEIADFDNAVMTAVLAGKALSFSDQPLVLHRSGEPERLWFDLDYSPLMDEAGVPVGVIAIVTDTTAKMTAETAARGEQAKLERMFEQAPGFMAMLGGPNFVFEFINPACAQLMGQRDVIGKPVREALPEIAGQGLFEILEQVFESGEAWTGSRQPIRLQLDPAAEPEQRFLDFVYQPIRDAAGRVTAIFVQGADVTDQVCAEAALRLSDARHRQILDSATEYGIIATDLAGRITRWNLGAERMFGWREEEVLGADLSMLNPADEGGSDDPQAEMATVLRDGGASAERWHRRRSGARFFASSEMTPLRDVAQQPAGFVKVLRDRTEEHRASEALREFEGQLRRAQAAGGVGVFAIDIASNLIHGTPEFCRIFGLEENREIAADVIEALVIRDDVAIVSSLIGRRRGEAMLDVEYRIRRADTGEIRTIARKAEYERDAAGNPIRLVGVVQDVTERRAVQRALEQSEAQFRTFAQTMPHQVWTAKADGASDWVNERVQSYSGRTVDVPTTNFWATVLHPDDLPQAMAHWRRAVIAGETYETEFRLRSAKGDYRWHLSRAIPIRTPENVISRWIGTNTDIHERKLAEVEKVRDRDRMWAMSQDLMLVCDEAGIITDVNPSATRLLGWQAEDMIGKSLLDFVHPADQAGTAKEIAKIGTGLSTLSFENRYRTVEDGYRLIDWTAVSDGDRVHGVGRDITESRSIARDQERIWNLSPVLKVVATTEGVIQKINPAWSGTLGWSTGESEHRSILDFVEEADRAAAGAALERVLLGGHVADKEFGFVTKGRRPRRIAWSLVVESRSIFGFGRDVTEQRSAEDALRQAHKMEAVGQLTGGIAHDFNNLLQGITGNLQLIQHRLNHGRVDNLERFADGAITSANRAAALTHRLLAFSRRQPLDPRPVRANPLIASMEDLLRRTLGEDIELILTLVDDLWLTRCDPNQLESAILNLVINARDAMPDGGGLTIETSNADIVHPSDGRHDLKPGQYVRIRVADTGVGMDAATLSRAFEPFFTTKPLGQGTGLGLSMIYGFTRQSEGYAAIESRPGDGTSISLLLPRYAGNADEMGAAPRSAETLGAEAGETVLVVEDEAVVRGLIVEVLSELGYRAIEAVDGPSGLEVLRSDRRIDLLITDIGLPGLNGRQMADCGRECRPGLRVLFMTGYAENAALASGFLEPGMAMITKPFPMEALAARIREMIEAR